MMNTRMLTRASAATLAALIFAATVGCAGKSGRTLSEDDPAPSIRPTAYSAGPGRSRSVREEMESRGHRVSSLEEAQRRLAFKPIVAAEDMGRIASIVVDDVFNRMDGSEGEPRPLRERLLLVVFDDETVLQEFLAPGFGSEEGFIDTEMSTSGADDYKKVIDLDGIRGIAYDKGTYPAGSAAGDPGSTEVPAAEVFWYQEGIAFSVGSATAARFEQLMPLARRTIAAARAGAR